MKFTNRGFGVEIEVLDNIDKDDIASAIRETGVEAYSESYNHTTQSYWKVVRDGSCGNEIVSPILSGKEGLEQIAKVCQALNAVGCKVNRSCGLHIHLDARDLKRREIMAFLVHYARFEKFFDSILPESRRDNNNSFCYSMCRLLDTRYQSMLKTETPVNVYRVVGFDRYQKVNMEAYVKYGSIEVRHHSGTIEADKIINWVVLQIGFLEAARYAQIRFDPMTVSVIQFKKWVNLTVKNQDKIVTDCAEYITKRFKEFNPSLKLSSAL